MQQNLSRRHVIPRDVTAQEIVFVVEELQDEHLVGSGAPGSYSLLDDLFAGEAPHLPSWPRRRSISRENEQLIHDLSSASLLHT